MCRLEHIHHFLLLWGQYRFHGVMVFEDESTAINTAPFKLNPVEFSAVQLSKIRLVDRAICGLEASVQRWIIAHYVMNKTLTQISQSFGISKRTLHNSLCKADRCIENFIFEEMRSKKCG